MKKDTENDILQHFPIFSEHLLFSIILGDYCCLFLYFSFKAVPKFRLNHRLFSRKVVAYFRAAIPEKKLCVWTLFLPFHKVALYVLINLYE